MAQRMGTCRIHARCKRCVVPLCLSARCSGQRAVLAQQVVELARHVSAQFAYHAVLQQDPFAMRAGQHKPARLVPHGPRAQKLRFLPAHHVRHARRVADAIARQEQHGRGGRCIRHAKSMFRQRMQRYRGIHIRHFVPAQCTAHHARRNHQRRCGVELIHRSNQCLRKAAFARHGAIAVAHVAQAFAGWGDGIGAAVGGPPIHTDNGRRRFQRHKEFSLC